MWEKRETKDTRQPDPPPTRSRFEPGPVPSGAPLVNIGPSIFIKGELSGDEDLTIEGKVEGKIELKKHNLTIGPKGKIQANVSANAVTIKGDVQGNVFAREKVEILNSGRLTGDICSPRIVISDGAHFRGSVDMEKTDQPSGGSDRSRPSASAASAYAHQVAEPVGASRRS